VGGAGFGAPSRSLPSRLSILKVALPHLPQPPFKSFGGTNKCGSRTSGLVLETLNTLLEPCILDLSIAQVEYSIGQVSQQVDGRPPLANAGTNSIIHDRDAATLLLPGFGRVAADGTRYESP
jgi:hypothetical protein